MTPPYLEKSQTSERGGSRKSSELKRKNLQKNKESIDISLKKSIELLGEYENLNEYYDDLSAKRVLQNADDEKIK